MPTDTNANLTGQPPAITYEQLRDWEKLADDIDAGLKMGGEQGMELLIGLMADWCVAADEVNSAYQTCSGLAARGLRDEAVHWHASGFFDIAERLIPERPGWEEWAAALTEREIVLPAIDIDLKMLVDTIFEGLQAINIETCHTLADEVNRLRRSMLIRGRLGERLTILQRLHEIDPSVPVWNEMMKPYRKRRADEIRTEVQQYVKKADCNALCRLQKEVANQNWDGDLPTEVTTTLEAATHWQVAAAQFKEIRHHATELRVRCQEGRAEATRTPRCFNAISKAREHRGFIHSLVEQVQQAVAAANQCPQIRQLIASANILQAVHDLDASCKEHLDWLAIQDGYDQKRMAFLDLDDRTSALLTKKPNLSILDFDEYRSSAKRWLKQTNDHLLHARKVCRRSGDVVPSATEAVIAQLVQAQHQVEQDVQKGTKRQTIIILSIIGGIFVVVGVFVVGILIASLGGS